MKTIPTTNKKVIIGSKNVAKFMAIALILTGLSITQACAQKKNVSDYSYQRAVDAFINDKDNGKALELVNKQLDETPYHLDARFLRAKIFWLLDRNDAALTDVTFAINHYKGKPDVFKSTMFYLQGEIYDDLQKFPEAVTAYGQAVRFAKKDNPIRLQDYKFRWAQAKFNAEDLSGAEIIYHDMLKDFPGDVGAMVGLARNMLNQEKYEEGLKWLKKAESFDEDYSEIYRFKMKLLDLTGQTDESIDAALKYFELDQDALETVVAPYAAKHYSYGVAKIKAAMNKGNDSDRWLLLLTELYESHSEYAKALKLYEKLEDEYGFDQVISYYKSKCYAQLGQFSKAIEEATRAIELEGGKTYYSYRGDIYRQAGIYDKAIEDYKVSMEEDPTNGYEYYAIGWCYELDGNAQKALEYYNQGIDLDKNDSYLLLNRGDLLKKMGEVDAASADYERVLEIDDDPVDGSCRHFALLGLGRTDEAVEWMDRIIDADPYDSGHHYDMACLLARMGKTEDALKALEEAFRKGYRKFAHLEHDDDMDPLRDLEEYKELVQEYMETSSEVNLEEQNTPDIEEGEAVISEVSMKKMSGGTYEIPCTINGLPLKFILDTGASDVTISNVEANFMLKNNYLNEKDFKGSRKYITADGDITEGSVICLKEVLVGDIKIKNIEACVVKNQKAPLLLGQTVLERFGKITIDNEKSMLVIMQR